MADAAKPNLRGMSDEDRVRRAERRRAAKADRRAAGISTKPQRVQTEDAEFATLHVCECGHQRYKHIPGCCYFPVPAMEHLSVGGLKCQCREFVKKVYPWETANAG